MLRISIQTKSQRLTFYRFKCPACGAGAFATNERSERKCYSCNKMLPGAYEMVTHPIYQVMYYRKGQSPLVSMDRGYDY